MNFNRRIFLLRYLLLSVVGLLAPLLKSKSSSAQTPVYNDEPAPTTLFWDVGGVPGIKSTDDIRISTIYKVQARVKGNTGWGDVPAYETRSKAKKTAVLNQNADLGYYTHLHGWTHTYVNFEMPPGKDVEVKISLVSKVSINKETVIKKASVHPNAFAKSKMDGTDVIVTLNKPCLIAVDINGQMDDNPTGSGYNGPAIHTISIFANQPIAKPNMKAGAEADKTVYIVKVTDKLVPNRGAIGEYEKLNKVKVTTIAFEPGVHNIGPHVKIFSNLRYYIPGDAIVYGGFHTGDFNTQKPALENDRTQGQNIRIFGHGTLSSSLVRHPGYFTTNGPGYVKDQRTPLDERNDVENSWFRAIHVIFAKNVVIDGITIVDSPQATIQLTGKYETVNPRPNTVQWVKILNWRENSDGILNSGNTAIKNCFIRNQDDSLGVGNLSIDNVVQWNDANGAAFIMSLQSESTDPARPTTIKNCYIIYARGIFGGAVFKKEPETGGAAGTYGKNVSFTNITIEDRWPSKDIFSIAIGNKNLTYQGTTFENLSIARLWDLPTPTKDDPKKVKKLKLIFKGFSSTAMIKDFTFKNLKVGGQPVTKPDSAYFETAFATFLFK
jgi:hypothetical protein